MVKRDQKVKEAEQRREGVGGRATRFHRSSGLKQLRTRRHPGVPGGGARRMEYQALQARAGHKLPSIFGLECRQSRFWKPRIDDNEDTGC